MEKITEKEKAIFKALDGSVDRPIHISDLLKNGLTKERIIELLKLGDIFEPKKRFYVMLE